MVDLFFIITPNMIPPIIEMGKGSVRENEINGYTSKELLRIATY